MEVHTLEQYKSKFIASNTNISEVTSSVEHTTIGKFQSINEEEEELWFLQCPKGMDLQQLEEQKLKLPGRSSISSIEAVAVESASIEEHAFGYCNRKGRYALRILPVRGSIIIRNKLKASDTVTIEKIEECCPPKTRVPAPNFIKVRHPLFGVDYSDKLDLRKDIRKKLKFADDNSTQVMHDARSKRKQILRANNEKIKIKKEAEENALLNDSKKSKKRSKKHTIDNNTDTNVTTPTKKSRPIKKAPSDDEEISPDLKWLQEL